MSFFPSVERIIDAVVQAKRVADNHGIIIDNYESLKLRINGRRRVKSDLANACWNSLCVYADGGVYPSASLAGYRPLMCGSILEKSLKEIWLEARPPREIRSATVQKKGQCVNCHLKFICGGGDIEHGYFYSESISGKGSFLGFDPYCNLYKAMISDVMLQLALEKKKTYSYKSGFDRPKVIHAMGEGTVTCASKDTVNLASDYEVQTKHSACVLSVDIVDKSREIVREFYTEAAEEPKAELCCPSGYPEEDLSHIPKEVLDRFYGCGSPMSIAGVKEGEVVADLGSGAGIDCFIAAKKVGPSGKVIGVDMTDKMLEIANANKVPVAKSIGFDVVKFRKGYLEEVPVEDKSVDLITSNCVINLSPDKKRVFKEMWRILKDHGRVVISDIVTEKEIPSHLRVNERLWGECMSGALTEEEFLSYLEQAGFYGVSVLKKTYWKEIEGYKFHSITVRGYKFEKKEGCVFIGQRAIYLGPYKAVVDEEGHLFPRGEEVEICTDTASKLSNPPYEGMFIILEPGQAKIDFSEDEISCCAPGGSCG